MSVSPSAASRTPEPAADRRPLPVVIERLAQEIEHIANQIREVDEALGAVLTATATLDVRTFQQVDLIRQEMEGLKSFVHALAQTISPDSTCDPVSAAQDMRLRAQQQRMRDAHQG
jgi:hypothetical protein